MPGTAFSTGGDVEHQVRSTFQLLKVFYAELLQVIMIGGILFFVIESKLNKPSSNNLAQLFLEFLCACSNP
jgi:hypothetical protein